MSRRDRRVCNVHWEWRVKVEELKDTGSQMPDCGLAEVTLPMTVGTHRSVLVCGEEVNTLGSEEAMGGQS